jgi:hypothetical protein
MRHNARRQLVLGVGLAALVGGTATGQFAVDRVPPVGAPTAAPPTVPGGLTPVSGYQPPAAPVPPAPPGGSLYTPLYSAPGAPVPPAEAPRGPAPAGSMYGSPPPAAAPPAAVPTLSALPLTVEIPSALPKDHPWVLRTDHGPYFIIVKSYVRPARGSMAAKRDGDKWVSALELAEGLAREVRETYQVQAFLYEYISEERRAEIRAHAVARQKAETEYLAQVRALEQKAQLQGFAWEPPDNKLRMRMNDYQDQIGVLVGPFQNEHDALKALAAVKKWEMPKNKALLDRGLYVKTKGGEAAMKELAAYVNPYESASVVPNPAAAKTAQPVQPAKVDPFIVKLNDGRPYNLLKATKGWTLGVKTFSVPVELNRDQEMSLARASAPRDAAKELVASAQQAEALAKALRALKGPRGEALNLEAFVLHTRTASMVTVGQFDAPDDPALLAVQRILSGMKANVTEDPTGLRPAANAPSLLSNTMLPIPIPKL